jgi:putative FmdB family regulatory protein
MPTGEDEMPIYEYHCGKCGHEFEVLQKSFDVDEVPCETCGGQAKRMISSTSFVLKGTGWYVTDYKKGGGCCPDAGGNGKANGDKAAKSETTSSDTKADASSASCSKAASGSGCSSCAGASAAANS